MEDIPVHDTNAAATLHVLVRLTNFMEEEDDEDHCSGQCVLANIIVKGVVGRHRRVGGLVVVFEKIIRAALPTSSTMWMANMTIGEEGMGLEALRRLTMVAVTTLIHGLLRYLGFVCCS